MARIECSYFSDVLGLSTQACVLLPQAVQGQVGMGGGRTRDRLPVLYLLHGMSDDHTIWTRRTSLERYVAELELAVVMPSGHRGFYTDQASGYPYWTHLAEEVPAVMASFFPLSTRREDTFVAGLSMGGYGALKLGLRHPERFAAAASLSGALDVQDRAVRRPGDEWVRTFGSAERARANGDDLLDLVTRADPAALPPLWAWCGTEDELLGDNHRFRDACREHGVALDYAESPGAHDWAAWDEQIQRVLAWLPLNR